MEYTPYGEIWIEDQQQEDLDKTPYRFTSKEWDEETKLYYMSARYQNPMTSRWISADPAGSQLINPMDDEGNLREGFSIIESTNWYSYVGNSPVTYFDPTGKQSKKSGGAFIQLSDDAVTGLIEQYVDLSTKVSDAKIEIGNLQASIGRNKERIDGIIEGENKLSLTEFTINTAMDSYEAGMPVVDPEAAADLAYNLKENGIEAVTLMEQNKESEGKIGELNNYIEMTEPIIGRIEDILIEQQSIRLENESD